MFKSKIRMWSIVINHIPAARLETWAWWLGVFAITLPILGGVCGWLSFEMNDTVTHRKEVETQQQIAEARAAALPKPLKIRLIAFLDSLDKHIMPALAAGQTKFSGSMRSFQLEDLKKLCAEPDSSQYITLDVSRASVVMMPGETQYGFIDFILNPSLLKP
jgi:hypothetical protein